MNELVYKYFKEISEIPRETYHIEKISNYLVNCAKKLNLEVIQDELGNVVIKKEASEGYFDHDPIIIQGHMDMVCQKMKDSLHNFFTDPIEIIEEDGYLRANQTTLGADDGIGMAITLALLESDIKHPKIEALFTVNEEVGMEGAIGFDFRNLDGNRLINVDSEDEGILTAGCAGGVRVDVTYTGVKEEKEGYLYTLTISNLLGGHSGIDINKNRVNAIKCIGDFLAKIDGYFLVSIDGGKVDNAICDECSIKILFEEKFDYHELVHSIKDYLEQNGEKQGIVSIHEDFIKEKVFSNLDTNNIKQYISQSKNGVIAYEEKLGSLVKTSLNFGVIKTKDNIVYMNHSVRSSNDNERDEVVQMIFNNAQNIQASTELRNPYSGWKFNDNSKLRNIFEEVYQEMFHKDLVIDVVHAGLECGIFIGKRDNLDCVSIGPNILGAHTPEEKVEIASVNRTFDYLIKILEKL